MCKTLFPPFEGSLPFEIDDKILDIDAETFQLFERPFAFHTNA